MAYLLYLHLFVRKGRVAEIDQFREPITAFAKGDRSNRTMVFEGPVRCGKCALITVLGTSGVTYKGITNVPLIYCAWRQRGTTVMAHWEETYVDKGELRPQDDVSIGTYVRQKDRTSMGASGSPFFSGRVAEINRFRESVAAFAEGDRSNRTLVFEGPPGCGKSALLMQMACETNQYPDSEGRRWLTPVIDGGSVMSPASLMVEVNNAIARRLAEDALTDPSLKEKAEAALSKIPILSGVQSFSENALKEMSERGITAGGFGIGAKREHSPVDMQSLAQICGHSWWDWNIVLMIDEAQRISEKTPNSHPSTLSKIHQGLADLPIMFCAFGLYGTSDALGDVGVSRASIAHTFNVSGLDAAHSGLVVDRAFKQFGIRNGEHWKSAILERSKDWPQHLSCYLTSALGSVKQEMESNGLVDVSNLSIESFVHVADDMRGNYYDKRIDSFSRDGIFDDAHLALVAASMEGVSMKNPMTKSELRSALIERGVDRTNASALIKGAAACGLLAYGERQTCHPAIPSFVTHLIGESQSHEVSEELAKNHPLER